MSYELNYIQDIEIKKTIDRFIDSLISVKRTKTICGIGIATQKNTLICSIILVF